VVNSCLVKKNVFWQNLPHFMTGNWPNTRRHRGQNWQGDAPKGFPAHQ
jgi:hypothetical protein